MSQTISESTVLNSLEFVAELPEITPHDRCDSCSQHAVSRIRISDTLPDLFMCGHHWRKNSAAIKESGYRFYVPESVDVLFTNRLRDKELAEANVSGASGNV